MTFIQDMLSDITNMSGYDLGTTWCGGRETPTREWRQKTRCQHYLHKTAEGQQDNVMVPDYRVRSLGSENTGQIRKAKLVGGAFTLFHMMSQYFL